MRRGGGPRATRAGGGEAGRLPLPEMRAMRVEILRFLDETSGRGGGAHKGLEVATRQLDAQEAGWKPPGGHSVWEQINHIAYWKRWILARLRGRRPAARQAWPPAGRTPTELHKARADLAALQHELRAAVLALDPARLHGPRGAARLLLGEAAHESYHIGQIFLIRKLYQRVRHRAG